MGLTRRRFIGLAWTSEQAVSTFPTSADPTTELVFMSATKLAQSIRDKKLGSLEVVRACLAQIGKVNPRLNAVVQLCEERALMEARDADTLLAKGRLKSPLHGVPMTIKDSFDTAGVVSTGGRWDEGSCSLERRNRRGTTARGGRHPAGQDEHAGADVERQDVEPVYGVTRNPYNVNHSPGGSSGGAAAIVASGGSPFDIGSDFGGSIRYPAHACGIAGLKPTTGRVPRTGHIVDYGGMFDSFQQVGPLARRVEDLITILPIISGPDDIDAAIVPMTLGDPASASRRDLRIAFYASNGIEEPTADVQQAARTCATLLADAGARTTEARPPF